jgi:hypothetical protein
MLVSASFSADPKSHINRANLLQTARMEFRTTPLLSAATQKLLSSHADFMRPAEAFAGFHSAEQFSLSRNLKLNCFSLAAVRVRYSMFSTWPV